MLARIATTAFILISPIVLALPNHYKIDPGHSFIEFKTSHLGISWLKGRFNDVSGEFTFDPAKPNNASISVAVKTKSIDSNHTKRDKHLRNKDFLEVKKHPLATFKSTSFKHSSKGGVLKGDFTLHGVTKRVNIDVKTVGAGDDPWGGYRRGYVGHLTIKRKDFNIGWTKYKADKIGPEVMLEIFIEGIREKIK